MAEIISTLLSSDSNLQAYYRFNTGAITTDSKNSNTLTNNNTVGEYSGGKYGYAADFSSSNTNKSLSIASNLSLTGDFSVSQWVKRYSEISSGSQGLFSINILSQHVGYGLYYAYSGGNKYLHVEKVKQGVTIHDEAVLAPLGTNWNHLVTTYTSSTGIMRVYLAGSLIYTSSNFAGNGSSGGGDSVGIGNDFNPYYWSGYIDDTGFFNRILTAQEILTLSQDAVGGSFIYNLL